MGKLGKVMRREQLKYTTIQGHTYSILRATGFYKMLYTFLRIDDILTRHVLSNSPKFKDIWFTIMSDKEKHHHHI